MNTFPVEHLPPCGPKIYKKEKELAWKNLKQKLISCQVNVDRYKSKLPDLQRLQLH